MMRRIRIRSALAAGVMSLALPISTTACFGSFGATKRLYEFNAEASDNKWINTGLFLGMNLIPVYYFGFLADAFFGNVLEFWGEGNPLATEGVAVRTAQGPNGEKLTMALRPDGNIDVHILHPDGREDALVLSRSESAVELRDRDGL